jgi:Holliday junction resolvase
MAAKGRMFFRTAMLLLHRQNIKRFVSRFRKKGGISCFPTGHPRSSYISLDESASAMSTKSRGSQAERELVHKFWAAGWAAFRAAGSGSVKYDVPDVIAGNAARKVGIEAKITTEEKKYFTKEEVESLVAFCQRFGCESWVAVRFFRKPWRFIAIEDLRKTNASYVISQEDAERKGLTFEELVR